MNERDYLDHHARRTADNVTATVESTNDDGTYMVRTVGSRALRRASTANPLDKFKAGQRVIVSEPSATRNVIGSEAVIQSRAPRDQRGLSETTPAESRASHDAAFVTSVDPDPLVLEQGGDAVAFEIRGHGLTEAGAFFGADGEEPEIVDADAAVITTALVTRNVQATADAPRGDYTLVIDGVRVPRSVRVIARNIVPPFLIVSGADIDNSQAIIWVLHPTTFEVRRRYQVPNRSTAEGIVYHDRKIYFVSELDNPFTNEVFLGVIDLSADTLTDTLIEAPINISVYSQMVVRNGRILLPGGLNSGAMAGLWSMRLNGDSATCVWIDAPDIGPIGVSEVGAEVYVCGLNGTAKLSSAFAQLAVSAHPSYRVLTVDDTHIMVCQGPTNRWLLKSDLTQSSSYTPGASANRRAPFKIGSLIYTPDYSNGKLFSHSLDGTVNALTGTIANVSPLTLAIVTDGANVLHVASDMTPRRVGVDGAILFTGPTLTAEDEGAEVEVFQAVYVSG